MQFFTGNKRNTVTHLIQSSAITEKDVDKALGLAAIYPDTREWKHFIEYMLLFLGTLAVAASAVFFIAYNWDALDRFAKFGITEVLIALSVGVYLKANKSSQLLAENHPKKAQRHIISQLALLVASIFVGVLLALYGQTYQTGADTWQLFLTWAILVLPWTITARFTLLWLLWLALIDTALILYFDTFRGILGTLLGTDSQMLWTLVIVNSLAMLCGEWLLKKQAGQHHHWALRLIAISAGIPMILLVLDGIFNRYSNVLLPLTLWVISLTAVMIYNQRYKPDLFMLAMGCLSVITVVTAGIGKLSAEYIGDGVTTFIILTLSVIALGAGSAIWLKNRHQQLAQEEQDG